MGDVIFRRINGRVVPIRKSGQGDKDKGHAAAKITAGLSAGVAAGTAAAALDRTAAGHENVAHGLMHAWRAAIADKKISAKTADRTLKFAVRNRVEAMRFSRASKYTKQGGMAVGAALIGAGIHDVLKKKNKDNDKTNAAVSTAGGIGAAFAIRSAYNFGMQAKRGSHVSEVLRALGHAAKRMAARGIKL